MTVDGNTYSCSSVLSLTMMDGKICSWLAHSSSKNARFCYSKPSFMNDLEDMKSWKIVAEIVKMGISSLPVWIKYVECLLSISNWMDIKKPLMKADRPVVDACKKEVQEKFRRQVGLLVDAPKHVLGTTNDGNTARTFY
ncbi:uncharacterized protein TNCT_140901 [Trichonephila clavata]|uniref:Uncharacterized protein n=1 Tax=Trichonephila clavata TaxID=2740835 RepID=A0A8X6KL59_TRICU|nr:uncharacterized protein TNCT_140901 [Trichonephila clavata]